MRAGIALLALGLAACATTAAPDPATGMRCDVEALGDLVGKTADAALGAEALRRSGARTIRWLRPDSMMTMDYRADRLNVKLDAGNQVTSFTCG